MPITLQKSAGGGVALEHATWKGGRLISVLLGGVVSGIAGWGGPPRTWLCI